MDSQITSAPAKPVPVLNPVTLDYQRTRVVLPAKVPAGLDAVAHRWVGWYRRRSALREQLRQQAERIDQQADAWQHLSDRVLHERLKEFRDHFRRHGRMGVESGPLEDALAAIREAAARQTALRPFRVQLMGALALHRGFLAEMATGEGKTLTAAMAAVLAGWTGRPCHVITVNDYLAQRDAEWFRPLYRFCGVSYGYVTADMEPALRQLAYSRNITYTTSKEITADFLRDRLRLGLVPQPDRRLIRQLLRPRQPFEEGLVLRGLDTAIIDEADSVLIDEAVTPLIISAARPNTPLFEAAAQANEIASELQLGEDYRIEDRYREIEFKPGAEDKLAAACDSLPGFWRGPTRRRELIQQALTARQLFRLGQHYVLQDGKVVIVDEFTGRMMPQRTWRYGLHQAIEAKEGLDISPPTDTLARLSFQRFFRLFRHLAGMTGTAAEAADELWHIYRLPVVSIPPNKPCIRKQYPIRIFPDRETKWRATLEIIQGYHNVGRPLLIGTRSVRASQELAGYLDGAGLEYNLLNALNHRQEAQIVAEAGQPAKITIATNMAGRGTDIKLGAGVADLGGLHVIATELHESQRIDRQLYGRSARQGDPGSAQHLASVDDELFKRFLPAALFQQLQRSCRSDQGDCSRFAESICRLAQRNAQALAFRQRAAVLKADTWLDEALSFAGSSTL